MFIMDKILQILKTITTNAFTKMIVSLCDAVSKVFGFLEKREDKKEAQQKHEAEVKAQKDLKNVCDNGTL